MNSRSDNFFQRGRTNFINSLRNAQDEIRSERERRDLRTQEQQDAMHSSMLFATTENSYSGSDCTVVVIYNENMLILGNLSAISYSIHREKSPVRTLGRIYAKNYTRGSKTIAGSLIFTQFNEAPLYSLYDFFHGKLENNHRMSSPTSDEIPPFDIMLLFTNEFGKNSVMRLYGVEISDEGGNFSINDIYSETVMQFLAKDIDPMFSSSKQDLHKKMLFDKMAQGLVVDAAYDKMLAHRSRLQVQIGQIKEDISKLEKTISEKMRNTSYRSNRRNTRNQIKNTEIKLAQEQYKQKVDTQFKLYKTLDDLNANIARYEKTRMTWDMNYALDANITTEKYFTEGRVQ